MAGSIDKFKSCLPMWDFLMKRAMDIVFETYTGKSLANYKVMTGGKIYQVSVDNFKSCLSMWHFLMKWYFKLKFKTCIPKS